LGINIIGDLKSLAEKILPYAPTVAGLLGGPLASGAVTLISSALGVSSNNPDDLINAIGTNPNVSVQLKQLEDDVAKFRMKVGEEDTQNARQMAISEEKLGIKPIMPMIVTIFLMTTFSIVLLLLFMPIATNLQNSTLAGSMIGLLTREFIQACRYYIGGDGNES
jgi:hypothetical protein